MAVYKGEQTIEEFLDGVSDEGLPNRAAALEEMLMLWVAKQEPCPFSLHGAVRRPGADLRKRLFHHHAAPLHLL